VRKLSHADETYCAKLDKILVREEAIQFRKDFPSENSFARVLVEVLTNPDGSWRSRPQFCGIDRAIA